MNRKLKTPEINMTEEANAGGKEGKAEVFFFSSSKCVITVVLENLWMKKDSPILFYNPEFTPPAFSSL